MNYSRAGGEGRRDISIYLNGLVGKYPLPTDRLTHRVPSHTMSGRRSNLFWFMGSEVTYVYLCFYTYDRDAPLSLSFMFSSSVHIISCCYS